MISYSEALAIIAGAVKPLRQSERALDAVEGCVAATDVESRLDVPAFANSAMDGFAIRSADTEQASETNPLEMSVIGVAAAGDPPATEPVAKGAVEIMTGAPVPPGCDTIIPVEQVETKTDDHGSIHSIKIRRPVESGRHIRRSGEDFRVNQTVISAGSPLDPHAVIGLAATGTDRLSVRPAPGISIITTGKELAAAGVPSRDGMIRDANGPYLTACIRHIGAGLCGQRSAPDSAQRLEKAIAESCEEANIVLTTGGVSAGRFDLVPGVVASMGGDVLFHKVAIRPGKPLLFARLPDGTLLFGLPGNPIAVAVGLRFFVLPALRGLQGLGPESLHAARNLETIRKRSGMRLFGKAQASVDTEGRLEVRLLPGQESFRIGPLVQSNCWAIVDEEPERIDPGGLIRIAPLYPTGFLQP